MSKDRMKHCLDELQALADDGIEVIPEIVRSEETQSWIKRFFKDFKLDRNNPDHVDYALCVLSEHAFRDWPAGNRASDSEIFELMAAIDTRLTSDEKATLTQIVDSIFEEQRSTEGTENGALNPSRHEERAGRLSKTKEALRIKAKRYYEEAITRELDLVPESAQRLPSILERLAKIMETRRYGRTVRSSPRAGGK